MASSSGIKVPTSVTDEWAKVTSPSSGSTPPRALVLLIENDSFKHHATLPASSDDYKSDISLLLPSLPSSKTCASFVYSQTTKSGGPAGTEWILITFVPDDAPVRQKMLTASSQAGLKKALGEGKIGRSMFFTSVSDLTPSAFSSHLAHLSAPPPLTASETALLAVREAEAEAARESELSGSFRGMGLGPGFGAPRSGGGIGQGDVRGGVRGGIGAMGMMTGAGGAGGASKKGVKFGDAVGEALKGLLGGHGQDVGKAVMLQLDTASETLHVHFSGPVSPADVRSKLPPKEPCYTFYAWPQTSKSAPSRPITTSSSDAPLALDIPSRQGSVDPTNVELPATPIGGPSTATGEPKESETEKSTSATEAVPPTEAKSDARIGFIYTCPTGSTVKWRMMYSVNVGFVVREAESAFGIKVEKKTETSDITDLTESYLKTELFPPLAAAPAKSHSTSSYGGGGGGFRNFGAPMRSTTLPSASAGTESSTAASASGNTTDAGDGRGAGGSLPDSAFSVFGPRMNVGASGGSGGFARPRPAGKR